jgi:aryl-alcohol dehydrogenase-like predicted oxidoreductase
MIYRRLGETEISISALAFGAGPVPALMTGDAHGAQRAVLRGAIEAGINWFDTAATYGDGASERMLGAALWDLDVMERVAAGELHIATKVRLTEADLTDIPAAVRRSLEGSFDRLGFARWGRPRVTLLQLHNSVTPKRNDEPTSITPADVLGPRGVLEAFRRLRDEGLALHLGLTGIGHPDSLRKVIASGEFTAIQTPYHILNPTAGQPPPPGFDETDYGQIIADCQRHGVGVLAIRVYAGGALAEQPPSAHTYKTNFFPLALYERDCARAAKLRETLPEGVSPTSASLRFVLGDHRVASAIIGFGSAEQIDAALADLAVVEKLG